MWIGGYDILDDHSHGDTIDEARWYLCSGRQREDEIKGGGGVGEENLLSRS